MRYVRVFISCLLAIVLASIPNPASPELPGAENFEGALAGGCISPSAPHKTIRLDSMRVTIRLKIDGYIVDAEFHLFNTGDTTIELVGLPKHVEDGGLPSAPRSSLRDFTRFDAWVDGRKVEFGEVREFLTTPSTPFPKAPAGFRSTSHEETRWMVKEVTFPGYSPVNVRTRYEAVYDHPWASVPKARGYYHWGTARYWKGQVGRASFIIDSTDTKGNCRYIGFDPIPGPRAITEKMQRYEKADFIPPLKAKLVFGPGISRN